MFPSPLQAFGIGANNASLLYFLQCAPQVPRCVVCPGLRSPRLDQALFESFAEKSHRFFLLSICIMGLGKGASRTWHNMAWLGKGAFET